MENVRKSRALSIRLSPETYRDIEIIANKTNLKISEIARQALEYGVRKWLRKYVHAKSSGSK